MVVIWLCICASILTVSSHPIGEGEQESGYTNVDNQLEYLRGKRLNNNVYAITPCAAAAAANSQARIPDQYFPEARYYVPNTYGYENTYRVEDPYKDAREMLKFSDTNFMEPARFAYRMAPTYVPVNTNEIPAATAAYGIFPNANMGTCNVPLLFSCSPSVVTGQMVKPETQVYGSPPVSPGVPSHPDGYRGVDDHYQRIHANQEQAMYDTLTPVKKVPAAHSNEKLT
ncbi:uncharacterized protein LOC112047562 [Bicyclus anynana]|uniref:Uncharacterized protein LOC112047562 n=1 Tax=Bicyclus anynana TaxID=110368 RepID=A0A6J1MY25_BICAN|nr:uncharacterized protein LOC112047562 [Bicyclus anynana]